MTTLTFPSSVSPSSIEWGLKSNTQSFTSPLNSSTQTLELPGARWYATLNFTNLNAEKGRILYAFLAQLRGSSGRFYLYDAAFSTPRGVGTGTPLVKGASQTGTSLDTDGWTTSTTGILLAGDYIEVNGELKLVVADVDSDGSGNATLTIEPPLRSSPGDNDPITVTNPKATMMLIDDNQNKRSSSSIYSNNFSISCIEAFQ